MMPDRHHPTEDMRRQSADEHAHQIQTDNGAVPDIPGPEIADLEEWERKARTEVTPLPAHGRTRRHAPAGLRPPGSRCPPSRRRSSAGQRASSCWRQRRTARSDCLPCRETRRSSPGSGSGQLFRHQPEERRVHASAGRAHRRLELFNATWSRRRLKKMRRLDERSIPVSTGERKLLRVK